MKFAYQTETKQYKDQWHAVCIKHEFFVYKKNTIQLKRQCITIRFESLMLHVSIIRIG